MLIANNMNTNGLALDRFRSEVEAHTGQIEVIAMIFAASGLTSIVSSLLIRSRAFSPAQQLILRPS